MKIRVNECITSFDLIQQSEEPSYLAPDGSQIRLFAEVAAGGLCHCTLPPWQNAAAVVHTTVDEVCYCIEGQGEVWRKHGDDEEAVEEMRRGTSLTIPVRTHFQFRNTGSTPLCLLIATMPRWPGPEEAQPVAGGVRSRLQAGAVRASQFKAQCGGKGHEHARA